MHNFYSISTNFSSSLSIAITLISCTASSTSALLNELTTKMLSFNACSCRGQCVGNKAKGQISKRVFQENKARHIFRKTNISYPLIHTRTCAYHWVGNVRVSENLTALFSWNTRFEIRSFTLLPTNVLLAYPSGKRYRAVGLVVLGRYRAFTKNKRTALILKEQLQKRLAVVKLKYKGRAAVYAYATEIFFESWSGEGTLLQGERLFSEIR